MNDATLDRILEEPATGWLERRRAPGPRTHASIVIPARNEGESLRRLLPRIRTACGNIEVIVVDDGSTDDTADTARELGATVVSHPYNMGNGAAVKSGLRASSAEFTVLMDADGQHDPAEIQLLLDKLADGYEMVVGARGWSSQASMLRGFANAFYRRLAGWIVNKPVPDLTSGFRVMRTDRVKEFLFLLPNGFSYPTTVTMAFFRSGYPVAFVPITAHKRAGKSHIRLMRDGLRFLLIIFKVGTLYSPFKVFFPFSAAFAAVGISYYAYTFIDQGRFTNMSALLIITSILVFLIGLVSEQIASLIYSRVGR